MARRGGRRGRVLAAVHAAAAADAGPIVSNLACCFRHYAAAWSTGGASCASRPSRGAGGDARLLQQAQPRRLPDSLLTSR